MDIEFKGVFAQFLTSIGVGLLVVVIGVVIGIAVNLLCRIHNRMLKQKGKGFINIKD